METPETETNSPDIERRLQAILERFPDRFTDEQIGQIRTRIVQSHAMGTTLRKHDLDNGIGPVFDPRVMSR